MPRFAANLSMLYPQHDFLERFSAAAAAGSRSADAVDTVTRCQPVACTNRSSCR